MTIEQKLLLKDIRPTPNRILVARCLELFDRPISMTQIADHIDSIDKSGVYRVLTLFLQKHLVHTIDDGSGSLKYELCPDHHGHSIDDMHVHFLCQNCGQIFCIESQHIPHISLPDGFYLNSVNFVAKGLCNICSKKLSTTSHETP